MVKRHRKIAEENRKLRWFLKQRIGILLETVEEALELAAQRRLREAQSEES